MKSLISIFFLLFPCILWGQQSNRIKGSLVDTCHNPVKDASIVLMNQADSSQITWIVCKEHMFELENHCCSTCRLLVTRANTSR